MVNLNNFIFTGDSDIAETLNEQIFNDTLVKTFKGDDSIKSSVELGFELDFGIVNDSFGIINMGAGNDSLIGEGTKILNKGIIRTGQGDDFLNGVNNEGVIRTGNGDDSLNGVNNEGVIRTGNGDDSLNGVNNEGVIRTGQGNDFFGNSSFLLTIPNVPQSFGMINEGLITTNRGDDVIKLDGDDTGILNHDRIDMGGGNDVIDTFGFNAGIENNGTINMGAGNDSLDATGQGSGLINHGIINMGAGDDSLSGESRGSGIENKGIINMGAGNDFIGGSRFSSEGAIDLGRGDDVIDLVFFDISIVDGGAGFDIAQFAFNSDEFEVASISDNSLVLKNSLSEGIFTDIELFEFNDFSFSFDELTTFSTLDFDEGNLAAGTIVSDQFEGINISTSSEFGVMIFDTNNPTGGDDDLSADIGNALIISEDGDSADPDDNAAGGTISIEFDQLATVTSLQLLDIDELGSSINLFDDDSSLIEVIEIPALADGSLQEITLNSQGIARMDINLARSGALTQLNFFETIDDTAVIDTDNE